MSITSHLNTGPYYAGAKMIWQAYQSEAKCREETNSLIREIQEAGPLLVNDLPRQRAMPHPNIRIGRPKKAPKEGQVVLRYEVRAPDRCGLRTMNMEGWMFTAALGVLCPCIGTPFR